MSSVVLYIRLIHSAIFVRSKKEAQSTVLILSLFCFLKYVSVKIRLSQNLHHCLQKYQLDRISLHDSKKATYEHTKKCAENLMLLGQTDRAVQLLLETDSDNDNYYVDCLRYLRQFNLLIFLSCQREN